MKRFFSIIVLVFMVFCLTACNKKKEDEGFKPKLDQSTECKISIVGDYKNFEALEAEFDAFNEFYPNVELSYTYVDKYQDTIATVLDGNDAPNIFFSSRYMIGNSAYDSVFSHMENLADAKLGINLDCIRPSLLNPDSEGKVLMVPIFSTSYGMLVNNDLFAKEGLKVPTTLQELLDVCSAFHEKGYSSPMMGYSKKNSACFTNTVAYPIFAGTLAQNPDKVALANQGDPQAGEFMRSSLEFLQKLINDGCINLEECDKIEDNYTKVILRFFEGDVPMMICTGDTVSGTKKRENESEAFKKNPFSYSFAPIPLTNQGGYFIDSPSIEFSVNKDCDNLDMTNEFMRFLIRTKELNEMASIKRLVTPTNDMSFQSIYAPFASMPKDYTFSPEVIGIKDSLSQQIRFAAYKVGRGELSIDEAVASYGTFK